jgi:tetratricopeptide (TPR) repeat protein
LARYYLSQAEILQEQVFYKAALPEKVNELLNISDKLIDEGIDVEKTANIHGREVDSLKNKGWLHLLKGNCDEAFYLLKQSTQLAEDLSDYEGLSHSYYLFGMAAERFEEYSEAKAAYRRALDLDKNLNNGFWQSLARKRLRQLLRSLL